MTAKNLNSPAPFTRKRIVFGAFVLVAILFYACQRKGEETPALPAIITALDPDTGVAGTEVKISGSRFGTDFNNVGVLFNGKIATVKSVSETLVVALAPDGAGEGPVTVTVRGASATGPVFHYRDRLAITSASPLQGAAGTVVTLIGKGFSEKASENIVLFNTKNAFVKITKKDTLIVEVPFQAGDGAISVKVGTQLATGPQFDFIDPTGLTITDVTPLTGVAGQEVAITGTEFSNVPSENIVKFNGVVAVVKAASVKGLIAIVPASATSGPLTVEVGSKKITGPVFNILAITSLSAASGSPGTLLNINGDGFSMTASDNKVFFDGTPATVVTATRNILQVIVPLNATSGVVTVVVGGVTVTGPVFTVLASAITNINPILGFPESDVTISGQSFDPLGSIVKFNGEVATIKRITPTEIIATVPISATTGAVTIESNGRVLNGPVFAVIQSIITSITPARGFVGQDVIIGGTDFNTDLSTAVLKFNGVTAAIKSITATQIVATVPSGFTSGNISLEYGRRILYGPVFTLLVTTISTVQPATGKVGDNITISGTGFSTNAADNHVTFQGVVATVVRVTETEMVVTVPPGAITGNIALEIAGVRVDGGTFTVVPGVSVTTFWASDATHPLNSPAGLAFDAVGNLYVVDEGANQVIVIDAAGHEQWFAGAGNFALTDGPLAAATFAAPSGIVVGQHGEFYLADTQNNAIRVIENGMVSTLAGGVLGSNDGTGTHAQFNSPKALTQSTDGNIYVADAGNSLIRKITTAGVVTTLTGLSGSDISLQDPFGITSDGTGNLYVADNFLNQIIKITPDGTATTFASVTGPSSMVTDGSGGLYVLGANATLYAVASDGTVTVVVDARAGLRNPQGLVRSAGGILYVSDADTSSILKITVH